MSSVVTAKIDGTVQTDAVAPSGEISIKHYLLVLVQLGLVILLFRQFQIESAAFRQVAVLAFGGFAIHALLPIRFRLPFFLALSLAGIVLILEVVNGLSIIAIGLVLIGICHLQISFRARGALLIAAAVILALIRAQWVDGPVSDAIWPILGSMFMFRLIVYFYDLRHDRAPTSPVRTLAYFFMLPNVCFPLFPVIDYKTFRRNYFDDDAYRIYQVGIDWMVRGVIHLLLYRFVYYHLTLAPAEVTEPAQLSQYLVANFLLYLRVSGLFHLIIGMLYLFGFRLPETHNRYLLASSFTDFWRRINIYWKEFMQKLFYYPAVFRLRGFGTTNAMIAATLYVFILTWFLHAYQWFWLRGTVLLVPQDILFWMILGLLVVVNALYELKHGRKGTVGKQVQPWHVVAVQTLKTYGTFWIICILWSFWTTESLADWWSLWSALHGEYTLEVLLFPLLVLTVILLGSIERSGMRNIRSSGQSQSDWMRARLVTSLALVALVGISIESVHTRLGSEVATTVHSLRSGRLSRLDTAQLERGYYENLLSVNRFNSQLWEVYTKKPANWLDVENASLKRFTGGFAQTELIPSFVSESNYGTITINRWGMRDRDYELKPAEGTYRMAMLGASRLMGWGVGDGETFESLIEDRLNAEGSRFQRYEILNLGVPGYKPLQQLVALERALEFEPNAIVYVASGREPSRAMWYLAEVVEKGIPIPYAPLRDITRKAGVHAGMGETSARQALEPYVGEILAWTYRQIVDRSSASGAVPVFLFVPQVREGIWEEETPEMLRAASEAGFVVLNLGDVFEDQEIESIRLAEWDEHPNRIGHQLIAVRLYEALHEEGARIFRTRSELGRH